MTEALLGLDLLNGICKFMRNETKEVTSRLYPFGCRGKMFNVHGLFRPKGWLIHLADVSLTRKSLASEWVQLLDQLLALPGSMGTVSFLSSKYFL